ncbi:WbqC family protein [Alishewanella sp. HL-SH06]|uniref:WbqC family protein n=1 Tax=Alishewanella sp. HL-SH06 TaxID=3461144 RepID=UPI004042D2FE
MKKIAILQSNYIPWKGYFDLINMVDEFVLFDTAQYTKNDWRNRNKIKTSQGVSWLTIPTSHVSLSQSISDTLVSDLRWSKKHWQTISQNYSKAPFFKEYKDLFEDFYMNNQEKRLSLINARLIEIVNFILGIETKISWSSDYQLLEGQTEKLLSICKQAGADVYLSGPAAKEYFDITLAQKEGIQVEWMNYSGYQEYHQLYPPFEHGVSIIDLIFNEGSNAKKFMKSFYI